MYTVNVDRIEETLKYLEEVLQDVKPVVAKFDHAPEDRIIRLALERMIQVALETIADVGNHMIDGFIMRDPGSYEDIVEILRDEKVIPEELSEPLKNVVNYRKKLITTYMTINDEELFQLCKRGFASLEDFPNYVRTYIKNEM